MLLKLDNRKFTVYRSWISLTRKHSELCIWLFLSNW